MPLVRRTRGAQHLFAAPVKSGGQRRECGFLFVETDAAIAFEVQANLDAAGMKTFAPVEFFVRTFEIMPLEAHARATHAAVQMPPAIADRAPRGAFGERGRDIDFSRIAVFDLLFGRFGHGDNVPFSLQRVNNLMAQSTANK